MVQAIHGVNKYPSRLYLSHYSLAIQLIIINLFTAIISLTFLIFFNYFLLTNNQKIEIKIDQITTQTNDIRKYLQKNAVIRIPQFNEENCERLNNLEDQSNSNFSCGEKVLSKPLLDPSATQDYLIDNFLNQNNHIRVYDINLIQYADTESLYSDDEVVEIAIQKSQVNVNNQTIPENSNIYKKYKKKYFILFNKLQLYFDSKELLKKTKMSNISIKKINNKKYRLLVGPFKNFSALKTTYISLNNLGFENLNIYTE